MRSGFALSGFPVDWLSAHPADGDAEAVVGVESLGRDAAARAAAGDADAVPPRTAARATACAVAGPGRILERRAAVVRGVVPIAAPLVHEVAHVVEAERIRPVAADHRRRGEGTRCVWALVVAPRITQPADTAERCLLAFGLGGQSARQAGALAQPRAVGDGVEPADRDDGLVVQSEARVARESR